MSRTVKHVSQRAVEGGDSGGRGYLMRHEMGNRGVYGTVTLSRNGDEK